VRVLFVYSDISGLERYGSRKYYSGIGSLSAVLKAAGCETRLLYLQHELSPQEFAAQVSAVSPDVVAFSSTTHQYPYIEGYARSLKNERPELVLVIGGTHPTLVPDEVSACRAFDAVCVGEGEYPLRELAGRLEQGQDYVDVMNLWVRRGDQVIRNPMRSLIANLDELPYVDRDIFDYEQMLAENYGWVDIMSGRGCPYNCSYCCNPGLKQRYRGLGRYVRFRSVEHIMGELRQLRDRYSGPAAVRTVNFQDDTFTLDREWALDFCRAYKDEFTFPFWLNTRVENILDEELVRALAEAHCAGIRVGVENGDEGLRATVLKRSMSNAQIIEAFRLVRRHGLKAYTCNMIGIPGETPQSIQATIDLNRELAPDEFQFSVFYPYPMTELHDTCVVQGMIKPGAQQTSYYSSCSVLQLPTLTEQELRRGYQRLEALKAELALKRSSPLKHRLYRWLLRLYGDDGPRLQAHLATLRRWRAKT
jgi:anaerobic magnesium-protoporphyrin IX monomethyl ester cyclase